MINVILMLATSALPGPDHDLREAVTKGLRRLETSATSYLKNRNCFSCHHQAVTVKALASARSRGFTIDEDVFTKQVQFTADFFKPKVKDIRNGIGIGGASTTAAYALFTLQAGRHPRDETTDALVEFLLKKQTKEGMWNATTTRPPTEGSRQTIAALVLQVISTYGPADDEGDPEYRQRIQAMRDSAIAYLRKTKPVTTEDYVFQLRGLVSSRAGESEIRAAKEDLLKRQRSDGGWAQLDGATSDENPSASPASLFFANRTSRCRYSDAYATATALVALRMSGLSPRDSVYQRGAQFLLKTQDSSGGWMVTSRSNPIQLLFDNGDPGGPRSGFIGNQATGWAVLALLECVEKR
jgi:Prenyltransferase and squalene oxidase repeat